MEFLPNSIELMCPCHLVLDVGSRIAATSDTARDGTTEGRKWGSERDTVGFLKECERMSCILLFIRQMSLRIHRIMMDVPADEAFTDRCVESRVQDERVPDAIDRPQHLNRLVGEGNEGEPLQECHEKFSCSRLALDSGFPDGSP